MMKLLTQVFLLPVMFLIIIPVWLWFAFAASTLWGWFVVPLFGLPFIGAWQAMGLMLVMGAFRPRLRDFKKDDRPIDWEKIAHMLIAPAVALGLGAALKFWVMA